MILNPNAQKWVDALRSGKYKQCKRQLKIKDGKDNCYCPLGLACHLAVQDNVEGLREYDDCFVHKYIHFPTYDYDKFYLPSSVMKWLKIRCKDGSPITFNQYNFEGIDTLNDKHDLTFSQIADLIEEQAERLFYE